MGMPVPFHEVAIEMWVHRLIVENENQHHGFSAVLNTR
jgi:hypothetical protein